MYVNYPQRHWAPYHGPGKHPAKATPSVPTGGISSHPLCLRPPVCPDPSYTHTHVCTQIATQALACHMCVHTVTWVLPRVQSHMNSLVCTYALHTLSCTHCHTCTHSHIHAHTVSHERTSAWVGRPSGLTTVQPDNYTHDAAS